MKSSDYIWITFLGGLIVADVVLLRTNQKLLTTSARAHKYLMSAIMGGFALHVFDVLGDFDPFDLIGFMARKKIQIAEVVVVVNP